VGAFLHQVQLIEATILFICLANAQPGDLVRANVPSVGLGLRWQWQGRLGLSLDLAYVINGAATTSAGDNKLHFNFYARL